MDATGFGVLVVVLAIFFAMERCSALICGAGRDFWKIHVSCDGAAALRSRRLLQKDIMSMRRTSFLPTCADFRNSLEGMLDGSFVSSSSNL